MGSSYLKNLKSMARKLLPPKIFTQVHNKARAQAGGQKRASNIKKKKNMQIQTLIFDKAKFNSDQAMEWAKKHNFDHSGVDETEGSLRLRQKDPGEFKTMRTIQLKPGVKAVVGKTVMKDVDEPPHIQNPDRMLGEPYSYDEVQTEKGQPDSSDVHVASMALQEPKKKLKKIRKYNTNFGEHLHMLDRPGMKTEVDGDHIHCFILPDGSKVYTEPNGAHEHLLDEPNADYIWYNDGEHQHKIIVDGVDLMTEIDGKHAHQLLVDTTLDDGTHTHGLVIPALGMIYSQMPGEYFESQGGMDEPQTEEATTEKGSLFSGTEGELDTENQGGQGNTTTSDHEVIGQPKLKIHIGSGQTREQGHIGVDTYPHDKATFVHDVAMGLPFPDESVHTVKMSGVPEHVDQKWLLSEIQRVLMPGGYLHYEGPNELSNHPEHLVMMNSERTVAKDLTDIPPNFKQDFTRLAIPDAATADDAEPRIGVPLYDDLPSDALLAMNALDYYASDANTSGPGNRAAGYPSQGALEEKSMSSRQEDDECEDDPECEELVEQALTPPTKKKPKVVDNTTATADGSCAVAMSVFGMEIDKVHKQIPIYKMNPHKQLVYGVVLEPNSVDAQEDWLEAEEIEKAAHHYLRESRVVGKVHEAPINAAYPVESYIAPVDFQAEGQYGNQMIKKGSWVLGVKVEDPEEWKKVQKGEYQAFSVGGFGARR